MSSLTSQTNVILFVGIWECASIRLFLWAFANSSCLVAHDQSTEWLSLHTRTPLPGSQITITIQTLVPVRLIKNTVQNSGHRHVPRPSRMDMGHESSAPSLTQPPRPIMARICYQRMDHGTFVERRSLEKGADETKQYRSHMPRELSLSRGRVMLDKALSRRILGRSSQTSLFGTSTLLRNESQRSTG